MTLELSDKHASLDALRKMLAQAKGLSITVGVHDVGGRRLAPKRICDRRRHRDLPRIRHQPHPVKEFPSRLV